MSILATCSACQARFKAPDHIAGRRTRCPRCGNPLHLPSPAPPPPAREPRPRPVAPPQWPTVDGAPQGRLSGVAAPALALVVLIGLVVAAALLLSSGNANVPLEVVHEPVPEEPPPAPPPEAPRQPTKEELRAELLAELDVQEKEGLAPLRQQVDNHKQTLERLRKEENDLFGKAKAAAFAVKPPPRYQTYLKDLAAVMPGIHRDIAALARKREEFVQRRRKIAFEHPLPGDPKLEDYLGLYLTTEEISDLGKLAISAGSPRNVAQRHVQSAEGAGTVARPMYHGTFVHPDDKELAAVAYKVTAYRAVKSGQELSVHIPLHRLRGAWLVLELPERNFSVLPGPPPPHYLRSD
jgi:hypothetical protein